mmetsp:Transcript_26533/g.64047  ORF Transcript_26533/g.64047 Transcript_26533/m.64047 type:complete len:213 (+) Transcript_26533:447-1085(+)
MACTSAPCSRGALRSSATRYTRGTFLWTLMGSMYRTFLLLSWGRTFSENQGHKSSSHSRAKGGGGTVSREMLRTRSVTQARVKRPRNHCSKKTAHVRSSIVGLALTSWMACGIKPPAEYTAMHMDDTTQPQKKKQAIAALAAAPMRAAPREAATRKPSEIRKKVRKLYMNHTSPSNRPVSKITVAPRSRVSCRDTASIGLPKTICLRWSPKK